VFAGHSFSLTVVTASLQVNLFMVFHEEKDNGGGGDNWTIGAIGRAKLAVKSSPPTNQHPVFYRPDAIHAAQPIVAKH